MGHKHCSHLVDMSTHIRWDSIHTESRLCCERLSLVGMEYNTTGLQENRTRRSKRQNCSKYICVSFTYMCAEWTTDIWKRISNSALHWMSCVHIPVNPSGVRSVPFRTERSVNNEPWDVKWLAFTEHAVQRNACIDANCSVDWEFSPSLLSSGIEPGGQGVLFPTQHALPAGHGRQAGGQSCTESYSQQSMPGQDKQHHIDTKTFSCNPKF